MGTLTTAPALSSSMCCPSFNASPLLSYTRLVSKNSSNRKRGINCSWNFCTAILELKPSSQKVIACTLAAASLMISSQALAEGSFLESTRNFYQLAAIEETNVLNLDGASDGMNGEAPPFVMSGMSAKNFDPAKYAGRWFEVASLKRGFAGQGQEDCHCTQGVYTFDEKKKAIQVDTFCVHGSPDGYITGIRGVVRCVGDADLSMAESDEEKQEMISSKCFLKFPFLPFIPKLPYDVIDTDYNTFALVSGAKDKSFIQIYSRTPNPGPEFIAKYKDYLATIGYNPTQINDTPQDCEDTSVDQLELMMSMPGMEDALDNKFPDLKLKRAVQLNPFTSVLDTLKKLVELYFK